MPNSGIKGSYQKMLIWRKWIFFHIGEKIVGKKILNRIEGKLTLVTAHWITMMGMFCSFSIS